VTVARAIPRTSAGVRRRARHTLLALALGAGSAACGIAAANAAHRHTASPRPVTPTSASPGGSATSAPPLSTAASQQKADRTASRTATRALAASESFPVQKRIAVRVAAALTTYDATASALDVAARVTTDPARQRDLARAIAPLHHAGAVSQGEVIYPQMGGATTDRASVMVVVRQTVRRAGASALVQTRTLDIRLVRTSTGWTFDALASAGGSPVSRPATLSAAARAVVDNPRIFLADTARWDIYRGAISPVLLELMARIAQRTPYAVTVLETGHPYDVFGTAHASLHSSGRAVDINLLGNAHIVDLRSRGSSAYDLVQWLLTQRQVSQVGSPWDLDAGSGRSFTNEVHLDHIHVSV
jgi:hypothetical protein